MKAQPRKPPQQGAPSSHFSASVEHSNMGCVMRSWWALGFQGASGSKPGRFSGHHDARRASRSKQRLSSPDRHECGGHVKRLQHELRHAFLTCWCSKEHSQARQDVPRARPRVEDGNCVRHSVARGVVKDHQKIVCGGRGLIQVGQTGHGQVAHVLEHGTKRTFASLSRPQCSSSTLQHRARAGSRSPCGRGRQRGRPPTATGRGLT